MSVFKNVLGFGSADLYVSVNGGSETRVHHFDTKFREFDRDLDSDGNLKFTKGEKVCSTVNFIPGFRVVNNH